ncbi:phosphatidylinositol N-acetylglucosaminyltransferase subunit P [Bactrocera neohumeralis]|uniref:phosphatidylinositol N-acetylglucosaminyltransferase subunit P n=1 Tax=Bactrocera tryoni TaxID=59916 RepID=UPI001A95A6E6|nr:phosphatidylinositol N-acetylglucosaminyltransferase subunit P [Bactrocera tryoni]XP_050316462.1 phosphatidylinositol N-acetylglucosaminyltransferase subunit P [Bactrocera neohumeralis]
MPEHTPAPTPHRAVYGFGFYLLFLTLFILYVMWALLPTESWGLHYLPDKYFAAYLPILILMGMFFFEFFIYPGIGLAMTPNVDQLESVMDTALLLRHAEIDIDAKSLNTSLWSRVRHNIQVTPRKERKVLSNCRYCQGTHQLPAAHEQISTLRFLDLQDVNRSIMD